MQCPLKHFWNFFLLWCEKRNPSKNDNEKKWKNLLDEFELWVLQALLVILLKFFAFKELLFKNSLAFFKKICIFVYYVLQIWKKRKLNDANGKIWKSSFNFFHKSITFTCLHFAPECIQKKFFLKNIPVEEPDKNGNNGHGTENSAPDWSLENPHELEQVVLGFLLAQQDHDPRLPR